MDTENQVFFQSFFRGDFPRFQRLLQQNPSWVKDLDGCISDKTAIQWASAHGRLEFVRELLQSGASDKRNSRGHNSLSYAILSGHANIVRELIQNEARLDHASIFYDLEVACCLGHVNVVDCLLDSGFDPSVPNGDDQETFFFLAVRCTKVLKSLLKYMLKRDDIDVNARNRNGWTPLMKAVSFGRTSAIRTLLSHPNVNVNAATPDHTTALSIAIEKGSEELTRLLVEHGATLDITNSQGMKHFLAAREQFPQALGILFGILRNDPQSWSVVDSSARTPETKAKRQRLSLELPNACSPEKRQRTS